MRAGIALLALLASLAVHGALLWLLRQGAPPGLPDTSLRGAAPDRADAPMRLRVAPLPDPSPPTQAASAQAQARTPAGATAPVPAGTSQTTRIASNDPPHQASGQASTAGLPVHYYSSDELTSRPAFLRNLTELPAASISDPQPAPVVALLQINAQGGVDRVVLQDNALSDTAQKYIAESFSNMLFRPGMLGGMPVNAQLRIEIRLDAVLPAAHPVH